MRRGLLAFPIAALIAVLTSPVLAKDGFERLIRVPQDVSDVQDAVDAARPGDLILLDRGSYPGDVLVPEEIHDITIRGVDRNGVVFDGENERTNAIYIEGDNVALENMTAHDFDGNAFYWEGVEGFAGRYLTVYNVRLYGIYTIESHHGVFERSLVSGAADAAFYIGECDGCDATLRRLTARLSAVGYSGTNASDVVIEDSLWEENGAGILPNSYDVGQNPPPEERTVIRGNTVRGSGTVAVPVETPLGGFTGIGIGIAGGVDNVIEDNVVEDSSRYGIAVFQTIQEEATWPAEGNSVRGNRVAASGSADLALAAGAGAGNCFEGNEASTLEPPDLGCGTEEGSEAVAEELALPPPVAAERVPQIAEAPSYDSMPAPGDQPQMPGATEDLPGQTGPLPWVLSGTVALAGLSLLGMGLLRRRLFPLLPGVLLVGAGVAGGAVALARDEPPPIVVPPAETDAGEARLEDGQLVYTTYDGNMATLVTAAGDGTEQQVLAEFNRRLIQDPRWSPDGGRIAFTDGPRHSDLSSDVAVAVVGDGSAIRLTGDPALGECASPTWSPNGDRTAFVCGELINPKEFRPRPRLYIADADGRNLRRVGRMWVEDPAWSPDGQAIAFRSWVGPYPGSAATVRTARRAGSNYELFVMSADAASPRRLTHTPQDEAAPAWSPDGTMLAFQTQRDTAPASFRLLPIDPQSPPIPWSIYVMAADGEDPRPLTEDVGPVDHLSPRWISDDMVAHTAISFQSGEGSIVATTLEGEPVSEVEGPYFGSFDWHP
jgi:hypothetical protein